MISRSTLRVKELFKRFTDREMQLVDSIGFDIFRICWSLVVFCEIFEFYTFKELIYSERPFIIQVDAIVPIVLVLGLVFSICQAIGLFQRIATIGVYIVIVLYLSTGTFEYHIIHIYVLVQFLFIFGPTKTRLTLDRYIFKKVNRLIPNIHYFLIPFFALGVTYIDSAILKSFSNLWRDNLGVWLPGSYPHTTIHNLQNLFNLEWVMYGLSFFTLLFEITCIVCIILRFKLLYAALIGIGLHIGILLVFPIPWFSLAMIALNILLIPNSFWSRIFKFQTQIVDKHQIISIRPQIIVLFLFIIGHLLIAIRGPIGLGTLNAMGIRYHPSSLKVLSFSKEFYNLSTHYCGITFHTVFLDGHFNGYLNLETLADFNSQKPILHTDEGQPKHDIFGPRWAFFCFRLNSPNLDSTTVVNGLVRYANFIQGRDNKDVLNWKYAIIGKEFDAVSEFKHDFLKTQKAKPWHTSGYIECVNGEVNAEWKNPDNKLYVKSN